MPIDAAQRAGWNIFPWVRDGHTVRFRRMLELVMASVNADLYPAIPLELLNYFPARGHVPPRLVCIDIHTIASAFKGYTQIFVYNPPNYVEPRPARRSDRYRTPIGRGTATWHRVANAIERLKAQRRAYGEMLH